MGCSVTEVAIVNSGVANLASLRNAFHRLGADVTVTNDPGVVASTSHVVLPGVGSFGVGMNALRESGLDVAVRESLVQNKPLLAICLGMQMLAAASAESPGAEGLGIISESCESLPKGVRKPHLGWNYVAAPNSCDLLTSGYAAFANSYCLKHVPAGWNAAWTTHGFRFVSALIRGNILACQFHPELSGKWGLELIDRWLGSRQVAGKTAVVHRDAGLMERDSAAEARVGNAGRAGVAVDSGAAALAPHALPAPNAPPSSGLTRRMILCLDVQNGRVVKGVNFSQIRDAGDPATQAALYERQGADEIVILDIAATPEARSTQIDTVAAVRAALRIPLTVGGGVRDIEDARILLTAGADKVSVNSAAVDDPSLLSKLAGEFGTQCVVFAIDARRIGGGWEVLVNGGRRSTGIDAVDWAREGTAYGAGEVLLTSWDRDGTRAGCDVELLDAVSTAVLVPVIASGGIGKRDHVVAALQAGADAVLAASVFHDGDEAVADIKRHLEEKGLAVRL